MPKETFVIHTADLENIEDLTLEELGTLFLALMRNQRGEELPEMNKSTVMAFRFMSAQIERDNEKYEAIVEKRRAAAQKRWNKGDDMQMHSLQSHSVSDSDSVSDSVSDSDSERYISVSLAALPSLSPEEKEKIDLEFGDQAAALIGDVESYYKAHTKKPFPGWYEAVRTFSHNQKRWGTTARGTPQKIEDIANDLFKGLQ